MFVQEFAWSLRAILASTFHPLTADCHRGAFSSEKLVVTQTLCGLNYHPLWFFFVAFLGLFREIKPCHHEHLKAVVWFI